MRKSTYFTADFETSTPEWVEKDGYARVWAYAICEIGNPNNFIYGNNIEDFMKFCMGKKNYTMYFHNLKFDSSYILNYLLSNSFVLAETEEEVKSKTFRVVINDMGMIYSLEVYFTKNGKNINKVTFLDSLKLLNFSVEKIAKDFNLPLSKLELDYSNYREVGHVLSPHEVEYIKHDVEIMARALDIMFKEKLTHMTIGSCALNNFMDNYKNFERMFPILTREEHLAIKCSYRGGFTYLNPLYKDKIINNLMVLDVNSLYPSVQKNEPMPCGKPIRYEGKYVKNMMYPLYIQVISCIFEIKEGFIPTIQLKNNVSFKPNEYITSSNGLYVTLTLTNIDLELFLEHYNVYELKYEYGFMFKSTLHVFDDYINHWTNEKINAKKDGNGAKYLISKLMMNSLYGKFGTSIFVREKYPYLSEDGVLKFRLSELKERESVYLPVATFITSYARRKTITTSQKIRDYTKKKYGIDYYIYSDTDSIHMIKLPNEELSSFVEVDDYELGKWKIESDNIIRGKFIRQKCYIEEDDKGIHATIAGLPKKLGKYVNFENFKEGFTISASDLSKEHKLTYKQVKGGVILVDTDFSIK